MDRRGQQQQPLLSDRDRSRSSRHRSGSSGGRSWLWPLLALLVLVGIAAAVTAAVLAAVWSHDAANNNNNNNNNNGGSSAERRFYPEVIDECAATMNELVARQYVKGAYALASGPDPNSERFIGVGVCNERGDPWTESTILRAASMSKAYGVAAFMKLVENASVSLEDPLSLYIPEFAQTKVIDQVLDALSTTTLAANPLATTAGSGVVTINHGGVHGFSTGDWIAIEGATGTLRRRSAAAKRDPAYTDEEYAAAYAALSHTPGIGGIVPPFSDDDADAPSVLAGIASSVLNAPHVITVIDASHYSIDVSPSTALATSGATGGSGIKVLYFGAQPSAVLKSTFAPLSGPVAVNYYNVTAPRTPVTVRSILTMTSGHTDDALTGTNQINLRKAQVQAGTAQTLQVSAIAGNPSQAINSLPAEPVNDPGTAMYQWAVRFAQLPLLFHPGTDWTYGMQLSVLGRVIEVVTGRTTQRYIHDTISVPLGNVDTDFYVEGEPGDAAYDAKVDRFSTLYTGFGCTSPTPQTLWACDNIQAWNATILNFIAPQFVDGYYSPATARSLALINGGMYTTPREYYRFLQMMRNEGVAPNGVRMLRADTVRWMTQNHISAVGDISNTLVNKGIPGTTNSGLSESVPPANAPGWGLGLGVISTKQNDRESPDQIPSKSAYDGFFWGGVFNTRWMVSRSEESAIHTGTQFLIGAAGGTQPTYAMASHAQRCVASAYQ